MIEYTWKVTKMDTLPEYDGRTDVVCAIHWVAMATDGTYSAQVRGVQDISLDADQSFTPYSDLTEEQVVGWFLGALGGERVAVVMADLDALIAVQANPPVVSLPLPWVDNG